VDAFNYADVLNNASNPELAQEYLDLIISPEGQEILRGFGYDPIE
jgi:ABC-type molybdate transport system substrate-binding protein